MNCWAALSMVSMPQRHRPWCCGAACVVPPSSRRRGFLTNEPSVTTTATAPDPPVSVATRGLERLHVARPQHGLDHGVVDLAGRLAGDDHAGPHLAQLDAVGDLDDAVEDAEAGVAQVENRVGLGAERRRHPAGRGRLELLPAHGRVDQHFQVLRPDVGLSPAPCAPPASPPATPGSPAPTSAARGCRSALRAGPPACAAPDRPAAGGPPIPATSPRPAAARSRSSRDRRFEYFISRRRSLPE